MKLGKIYDYRNKEEAKKLIGKKVLATDFLYRLENPTENHPKIGIFKGFTKDREVPFNVALSKVDDCLYQFIREIEEEDEPILMTRRQLAEWVARGFGQIKFFSDVVVCFNYSFQEEGFEDLAIDEKYTIRSWDSDEWVLPTVDIYERDCRGIRRIE